ncbi:MAG: diguanylate cyclase domain-containing protein [Usitatibacter sp.]
MQIQHDTSAGAPMTAIVRIAVVAVTLALFAGSTLNAIGGQRDLAILFALATPLGISAWGFARAGHNEAALVLLCCVLVTLVTLVLMMGPLGVHNTAVMAYGGIVLVGALLLSRRSFYALTALAVIASTSAFVMDILGLTRSRIPGYTTWGSFIEFLVILAVFAALGRRASEILFGSLGDAHRATSDDPVTGLANRQGFLAEAAAKLKALQGSPTCSVLVLADLDEFRRVNVVIGHRAGDGVLREAAVRIRSAIGTGHVLARIGDDEFAVLGVGLRDEALGLEFARAVHEALQFEFAGVSVRASTGLARFPRDAHGIDTLLLAAESSLSRAKDHVHEAEHFAGPADRI